MLQEKMQGWKGLYGWCERVIFPAILLLYPLRHIFVGAEWWDTGYNYGNFQYMDRMDPMWVFSTYLGNALGNLFTRLPLGNRMLGLNLYTGLLVSLTALAGYYFFIRKVRIPSLFAFAGELLALNLCWCPTALLYNYLTYFLFGIGTAVLYCGLAEDKKQYLVLAGICLGVNVFVRFPNLAEMGMIAGVWAYGFLCRKKGRAVLAETLWCILGYAAGAGLCLGYLSLRYGFGEYVSAIRRLFEMPSEAPGYTLYSMIYSQMIDYKQNLIWLGYLVFFAFLGVLGFAALAGRLEGLKKFGYVVCVFLGFYYLMMRNMFNLKYITKLSVFHWGVFLLTATLLIGLVTILRPGAERRDKLMLGLGMLVILITPFGSNNHLYSSINNLFFAAPFTLWMIYRFLKWLPGRLWITGRGVQKEDAVQREDTAQQKGRRILISFFPVKAMILCMLLVLGIQSMGFGIRYVFSEANGGENLHTRIEENEVLQGIYTSPDRAEIIRSISSYVTENGLTGKEVILYGMIPSMSYYLQMPFAITSWPDLLSYNYSVMAEDLQEIAADIAEGKREPPVMLLEIGLKGAVDGEETAEDAKFSLLLDWIKQYDYEITFENEKFILLQSAG